MPHQAVVRKLSNGNHTSSPHDSLTDQRISHFPSSRHVIIVVSTMMVEYSDEVWLWSLEDYVIYIADVTHALT